MTNSFRPQAAPVDTFVRPVSVAPPSDLDVLARALTAVNPGIEAFLGNKMDEAIEDEQQKGIEMAYDELLDDGSVKKITNKVKKKDGEEAANQLIGGSIFSQKAYERTKAKLTGQNLSANINNNYSSKTFTVIENGQEVIRPIYHFSASSPEFQSFLAESFNNENLLEGISNKYKNEIFQPYQYQAIQKITQLHQKEHNKYNIEKRKGQLSEVLFTNYVDYQDGKPDQAIGNIQQYIEETVNLGLSDVVKPDELIEIAKNHMSRIYEINEREKPGTGYNAAMSYLNMIGQIKHGPKELQKDGTYKQRLLVDSLGEDILKYKVELGDVEDKLVSRETAKLEAIEETDIINTITENPNSYSIANELLKKYPNRREFLFDQIEIYAGNRDELFNDFNYRVDTGYYGNDRIKMFKDLDAIKDQIGETWTDEDEQRFKLSGRIARESVSKRNIGSFESRIKDMHRDVRTLLGGTGEDNSYFGKDKERIATQYIDLKTNVNRRMMDELRDVTDINERETIFREIQAQYFKDAQAINEGTYETKGTLLTKEQKAKEAERQSGIQALVDEYGFGTEDATKIYDEQLNPQEFKDSQEEEKEPEKKEESSDKEKSWLDLFLKRSSNLKEEEKETLVGQLNNAKENLDESGTGVIDSVLNLLMGSAAAEQQTNRSVLEEIDVTKPFTFNSLERLAQEVGFSPEDARIAAAIALAESSGRAGIDTVQSGLDPEKKNEFSLGLWQIDMQDSPGYMLGTDRRQKFGIQSNEELYNPLTNAKAAKMIFDTFGFKPWATYTSGKYKDFLPKTD